jgi:hypothetical protein
MTGGELNNTENLKISIFGEIALDVIIKLGM